MSGHVRTTNQRGEGTPPEPHEVVIKIDRTNPELGNKHHLRNKLDRHERAKVIGEFRVDLENDIAVNGPMSQAIDEIVALVLAGEEVCLHCWCSPLPCHGDVIAAEVMKRVAARRSVFI